MYVFNASIRSTGGDSANIVHVRMSECDTTFVRIRNNRVTKLKVQVILKIKCISYSSVSVLSISICRLLPFCNLTKNHSILFVQRFMTKLDHKLHNFNKIYSKFAWNIEIHLLAYAEIPICKENENPIESLTQWYQSLKSVYHCTRYEWILIHLLTICFRPMEFTY